MTIFHYVKAVLMSITTYVKIADGSFIPIQPTGVTTTHTAIVNMMTLVIKLKSIHISLSPAFMVKASASLAWSLKLIVAEKMMTTLGSLKRSVL